MDELKTLKLQYLRSRYPSAPLEELESLARNTRYTDRKPSGLVLMISDYLKFSGWQVEEGKRKQGEGFTLTGTLDGLQLVISVPLPGMKQSKPAQPQQTEIGTLSGSFENFHIFTAWYHNAFPALIPGR